MNEENKSGVGGTLIAAGVVIILAVALFFSARESLLTLSRSVTDAGRGIIDAQAQQELEKAKALEIENERRLSEVKEQEKRNAEFTTSLTKVIQVGVPTLAILMALLCVASTIYIVGTMQHARKAAIHAMYLKASQVKIDSHTRAFPLIMTPDGKVYNPNLQIESGKDVEDGLVKGYHYIQGVGILADAATSSASRLSNPRNQAHDALPGIASNVQVIDNDEDGD